MDKIDLLFEKICDFSINKVFTTETVNDFFYHVNSLNCDMSTDKSTEIHSVIRETVANFSSKSPDVIRTLSSQYGEWIVAAIFTHYLIIITFNDNAAHKVIRKCKEFDVFIENYGDYIYSM